eukprot:jgi/Chlat1/9299/Chrsp99S08498
MGEDEVAEGCSNSVVVVIDNHDNHDTIDMLPTQDEPLSSAAVRPQTPAGDNIHAGEVHAAAATAAAAASSGKEAQDSKEAENSEQSKVHTSPQVETVYYHKTYVMVEPNANYLPCRICLGVDLEGCEPASLMPHAAIQSLQEEGLDLRHFMACGPHCAKPAGECATSPTQLRCGAVAAWRLASQPNAHYVCALGWLAKRKTRKCDICGQIVANIGTVDVTLFASSKKESSGSSNATAAGANNTTAQLNLAAPSCLKACGALVLLCVLFIVWDEGGMFTSAGQLFRCWSSLHELKKAIIVAASLLGPHIISLPCAMLIAAKAQKPRWDKDKMALTWCLTPLCLVLMLLLFGGTGSYCWHQAGSSSPASRSSVAGGVTIIVMLGST